MVSFATARKRAEWEADFKAREAAAQQQRQQYLDRELARAQAELQAQRDQAIPWARPILQFPPIVIRPSTKPLTTPQSPLLRTKQRAASVRP